MASLTSHGSFRSLASPRILWSFSRRWVRAKDRVGVRAIPPANLAGVQFDEGRADFPVDKDTGLDMGDLSRFLITHSMHLVTEFNSQASKAIGHSEVGWKDP